MPFLDHLNSTDLFKKNKLVIIGASYKEVLFLLKMMDILVQLLELEEVEAISVINSKNIFKKIDRFDSSKITIDNLHNYIANLNRGQSMMNIKFFENKLFFIFNAITFGHIQLIFKITDIIKDMFTVTESMKKNAIVLKFINNDRNIEKIDEMRNRSME